ncbi:TetR/AcrR family transcriptional regulator [uncultured Bilophila sp.]|uniref:TetR/AcrR family transcriptional regulator n=1 Tax=uncultured Bilophila sp. TaxID=529385 RepID=UPI0025E38836|nr:TetR/AcrR family transcriptional regulator [uncultured Bilophila sp.]
MKRDLQVTQTRERILKAAAACFAEKGYSGCSVQDIADRAEVSKGALYGHFKSKAELFKAMIAIEHGLGAERAQKAAEKTPYLDGIIWFMTECIRNSGFPMDHRLWAEVLAVAARDPDMRNAFVTSERATRRFFTTLLEKAAAAGEIDASLDLNAVSIWLYALGDGLIARIADDPGFDFQKHIVVFETLVRRALRA